MARWLFPLRFLVAGSSVALLAFALTGADPVPQQPAPVDVKKPFAETVRPILAK